MGSFNFQTDSFDSPLRLVAYKAIFKSLFDTQIFIEKFNLILIF